MSRFESPWQIAGLFAVAAMVSVVLIALLNAEVRSRREHALTNNYVSGNDSNNDNVLSSLQTRFIEIWSTIIGAVNKNETYNGSQENVRIGRSLMMSDSTSSITRATTTTIAPEDDETSQHRVRHAAHKLTARMTTPEFVTLSSNQEQSVVNGGVDSQDANGCYGPGQVFLVIGLTCAVNFAFVLAVMACVRACTTTSHSRHFNSTGDEGLAENKPNFSDTSSIRRPSHGYALLVQQHQRQTHHHVMRPRYHHINNQNVSRGRLQHCVMSCCCYYCPSNNSCNGAIANATSAYGSCPNSRAPSPIPSPAQSRTLVFVPNEEGQESTTTDEDECINQRRRRRRGRRRQSVKTRCRVGSVSMEDLRLLET